MCGLIVMVGVCVMWVLLVGVGEDVVLVWLEVVMLVWVWVMVDWIEMSVLLFVLLIVVVLLKVLLYGCY